MMKSTKPSVSVVVPCYNNQDTIIREVMSCTAILRKYCSSFEIIISDDASTDSSPFLLKKHFKESKLVRLLLRKQNVGIAKNIKHLYKMARKDFVLFYVADGDWQTKNIITLLETLKKTNADIVIGKRIKKGGYTLYRHIISYLHNALPIVFFGVNTVDAGSLKIYKRALFRRFPVISESIFHDAETIIRAKKSGALIVVCSLSYQKPQAASGVAASIPRIISSVVDLIRVRIALWIE